MTQVEGNLRVAVVEDDEDGRVLLEALLRARGYEVCSSALGRDGIALLRDRDVHLAFVDLDLPDVTGLDLARELRAAGCGGYLVALTGHAGARARADALAAGFDEHVAKPLMRDDFDRVVGNALARLQ